MLKHIVILCLLVMGFSSYAQKSKQSIRADSLDHCNIVKINYLSPLGGAITVHYEMKHTPNSSSQFEFFYFTGLFLGTPAEYKGAGVTYNYRYYIKGTSPKGTFVQPFGRIQKYDYVGTQNPTVPGGTPIYETITVYGAGIVFGYQTLFKRHFSFEWYGGPIYNFTYGDGTRLSVQDTGPPINGAWVRFGTTLGYVF